MSDADRENWKYPIEPSDPLDKEPPDKDPLYYRAHSQTVVCTNGMRLDDWLALLEYYLNTHHHDPEDIDETPEDQFVSQEQIDRWDNGIILTDPRQVWVDHGGILEGTTFVERPLNDILRDILYPYMLPEIYNAKLVAPTNLVTELGTTLKLTQFSLDVKKRAEPIKKIEILAGSTVLYTKTDGVANGGTFNLSVDLSVTTTTPISIRVTDAKDGAVAVIVATTNFVYPMYHGALSINENTAPTADQVKALTKTIAAKDNRNIFKFTCNNQVMCYAYPTSYGDLKKFYDVNWLECSPMFTKFSANIPCTDGKTVAYTVYTNNKSTVTDFEMNFRW